MQANAIFSSPAAHNFDKFDHFAPFSTFFEVSFTSHAQENGKTATQGRIYRRKHAFDMHLQLVKRPFVHVRARMGGNNPPSGEAWAALVAEYLLTLL